MAKIRVFVSSTINNLKEERNTIKRCLDDLFEVFLSEDESARRPSPSYLCLDKVAKCDIYILIIGDEYGYIPENRIGTRYNVSFRQGCMT